MRGPSARRRDRLAEAEHEVRVHVGLDLPQARQVRGVVGALPGGAVVVFAVGLLVALEAAELVEEGVGAGLEAVEVGEEAG